ncbi:MAG: hypothetical protein R3321_11590, partial [Nitrososphaeraceae archaeon]|nr:hypothetical protein [Nitrososphaeraceae archaeon]
TTTTSYRIMGIRLVMIASLTGIMTGTSLLINYADDILNLISNLNVVSVKDTTPLTLKNILNIQNILSAINLPHGYIIGIESIKAVGTREIFWVSNEQTFEELRKLDVNLINRNPKRLQYAKGYAYLVGSCNLAPVVNRAYKYNYYVCPIRDKNSNEVIGIVWVLYDVKLSESEDGLDISSELVPVLLELRDALETQHGFN